MLQQAEPAARSGPTHLRCRGGVRRKKKTTKKPRPRKECSVSFALFVSRGYDGSRSYGEKMRNNYGGLQPVPETQESATVTKGGL